MRIYKCPFGCQVFPLGHHNVTSTVPDRGCFCSWGVPGDGCSLNILFLWGHMSNVTKAPLAVQLDLSSIRTLAQYWKKNFFFLDNLGL